MNVNNYVSKLHPKNILDMNIHKVYNMLIQFKEFVYQVNVSALSETNKKLLDKHAIDVKSAQLLREEIIQLNIEISKRQNYISSRFSAKELNNPSEIPFCDRIYDVNISEKELILINILSKISVHCIELMQEVL